VSTIARVIIPDSHGNHIDEAARTAFLKDLKSICPEEIVMLGDHLDAGGTFSTHQRNYTNEIPESYEDDCAATNSFLDEIQKRAPKAKIYYLEGNHEAHVERWAARSFTNKKDADMLLERFGPAAALDLASRGIRYYKRSEQYMGLAIPGAIKLGKVYFVHGVSHSRHAAAQHVARFGANVVFGHVHRSQSVVERTVVSSGFGAWCPGTLAKLQPLYAHTSPTSWSHGYGLQFVAPTGKFIHWNVPIHSGTSLLIETIDMLSRRKDRREARRVAS
jgi:predicted phosphodiesterase